MCCETCANGEVVWFVLGPFLELMECCRGKKKVQANFISCILDFHYFRRWASNLLIELAWKMTCLSYLCSFVGHNSINCDN